MGYHSWASSGAGQREAVGWLVWTAFDFSPLLGQPESHEHFFGLWTLSLKPKPALDALPLE